MKARILIILVSLIAIVGAYGQTRPPIAGMTAMCYNSGLGWIPLYVAGGGQSVPYGGLRVPLYGQNNGTSYPVPCDANGNLTAGGAAGGDLSGNYPNPTVAKINGVALPTIAGNTGALYATAGVISINNAPPLSAANMTSIPPSAGLANGALGSVPYQSGSSATAFLAGNTAATDQVLVSHGNGSTAAAPTLNNAPALSAANMTSFPTFNQNTTGYAAGLAGGALGSILYQSASNTSAFLAGNTAATDQVLVSHGNGSTAAAPTFSNAPYISLSNATAGGTIPSNNGSNTFTGGVQIFKVIEPTMVGNPTNATVAAGAAISGTGTGYVAPACAASHKCTGNSGTVTFTTGSTAAVAGILLTITDTNAHTNQPDCAARVVLTASPYTEVSSQNFSYSTTVWTLNVGVVLTASTGYTITYVCLGY